jgi:diphosphomevalonate decarboxylase
MSLTKEFITAWRSPSNIAIIKYWGKHGEQLCDNPSLSITLSKAYTETKLTARPLKEGESAGLTFLFEGKENPAFASRIGNYLRRLETYAPCMRNVFVTFESANSFPHSSGIASSASAMSAVALCIADLQRHCAETAQDLLNFQAVSEMARLGSGSACRSVYGPVCVWGESPFVPESSDTYAITLTRVHPVFHTLRDTILIVDDGIKSVSSSIGHSLMHGHPYATARLSQSAQHMKMLMPAMHSGDLTVFGRIAEAEALSLHALMMTSDPGFILLHPNTRDILRHVRAFRESSGVPVYFTLDAGPNVHLLYPDSSYDTVQDWVQRYLLRFCKDNKFIDDVAGMGPERMSDVKKAISSKLSMGGTSGT